MHYLFPQFLAEVNCFDIFSQVSPMCEIQPGKEISSAKRS